MKTLTRNQVAKQLGTTNNYLFYWEERGILCPEKIRIGDRGLVTYTPELVEKAKKLLGNGKRRKKGKN